jgi:hypothetical protein
MPIVLTPTEKVAFLTQALSWTMSLMETPTLEMIRVSSAIPPGLRETINSSAEFFKNRVLGLRYPRSDTGSKEKFILLHFAMARLLLKINLFLQHFFLKSQRNPFHNFDNL